MMPGSFNEEDPIGQKTLELFASAKRFNKWLYQSIAEYCRGNVLEIGSGIGNLSTLLFEDNHTASVTLSDLRKSYCVILRHRFKEKSKLSGVHQVDLSAPDFDERYAVLKGKFDAIIALNVIEHIKDDSEAVKNCKRLLVPGGRLIVLVPAFQWLYNSLDKELGHYRRYSRKTLTGLFTNNGFEMMGTKYFNSPGIPGWWFSGTILRRKMITDNQVILYDKLTPVFRQLDKLTTQIAGLSVIGIGKKA
jgi:SAM-dependent methyltransferase